jgi:hypothetical protein
MNGVQRPTHPTSCFASLVVLPLYSSGNHQRLSFRVRPPQPVWFRCFTSSCSLTFPLPKSDSLRTLFKSFAFRSRATHSLRYRREAKYRTMDLRYLAPLPILAGLVFALLVYVAVATFLSYRRLQHIKGPWLASISPLWLFHHTVRGRVYLACQEALIKYGRDPPSLLSWHSSTQRIFSMQARRFA